MKNILLIFTDQQRADTIRAMGNPVMQTPNLDALASVSTVFERCYTPSPVCVPARLSMMSGLYPTRTGCSTNNAEAVYKGDGFYGAVTRAGYQSCCVGKLHYLIDPYGPVGFERRVSQEGSSNPRDDYTKFIMENYPYVFDYHGMRSEMYYVPQISPLPPKDHPTQWIGDNSIEFIRRADPGRPLFLMASFMHPHPPYSPPAPWNKLYRDDPPAPFIPEKEDLDGFRELIGDRCSCRRLMISEQDILRTKNFYYACVSFVDYQIGRIIQALKDKGIYDDTMIIFSSDHGDMMGDYEAIGKRTMVDSSCRVPLLIRYPGEAPCRRYDPCSLVDLAPTVLNYIGESVPDGEFDGLDLFGGKTHDVVFSQLGCGGDGVYMVTDGVRKLVYRAASERYFYFDSLPEQKDTYSPDNPGAGLLRPPLDSYRAGDNAPPRASVSYERYTKTHPHYPGRTDHTMRRDEEAAAIPAGYRIDL